MDQALWCGQLGSAPGLISGAGALPERDLIMPNLHILWPRSKLDLVRLLVLMLLLIPIVAASFTLIGNAFDWGGSPEFSSPGGFFAGSPGGNAFGAVFAEPGFWKSVALSYWIGLVTPFIALVIVILFVASFSSAPVFGWVWALMKPILAVPHAAAAFGLLFLIAPSGFIMRLLSPEISGFTRPPDWLTVNDPAGIAFGLALVIKEIPFLFFVTMAALPQVDLRRAQIVAGFGHGRIWGWLISVFPAVYLQIRLPVFAVIAFASSNVDVALVLGPVAPPPLSVQILRWMNDPDLVKGTIAAAAAIIQIGVTLLALMTWWIGEYAVLHLARLAAIHGWRFGRDRFLQISVGLVTAIAVGLVVFGLALLALWSLAGVWRFPDALPRIWTLSGWISQFSNLAETGLRAAVIAVISSLLSLVLVLASLENEYRSDIRPTRLAWWTIFIPLLVPQIAFMGGLSVLFLRLGIDGTLWSVIIVHMIFVFPYVYLTLADPWNAFDVRYLHVARTLGKGDDRNFWSIRLPMLLAPVLAAFALGVAVSISQYLPTLLIGAGRQPTITTEAIALASGGNRRLIGTYALIQTLLPFVFFALASLVPRITWANRRDLQATGTGN